MELVVREKVPLVMNQVLQLPVRVENVFERMTEEVRDAVPRTLVF